MSDTPPSVRIIRCPRCAGPSIYGPANTSRPFCCARCKNQDLGAWASEDYRVETAPPAEGESTDEPPPPTAH